MAQCTYHPEKKGTATCPTCSQPICDMCRLQGNSLRCGTCQSNYQKGGEQPGGKRDRVQCHNHQGVPTDQRCVTCRKPYCAACLNGASKCFNCALAEPVAAPRNSRPASKGAPAKKGTTGKQPAKGTGKLKKGKGKAKADVPWPVIGGVAGLVLAVGLAAMLMKPKPVKPYVVKGPMKVAIVAPAAGRSLSGPQVIKLKVTSPGDIEKVELTVDGKYWDKLKAPPFQSDWPTSLLPNGSHTIAAKAIYKNKKSVSDKRVVRTFNR
jgi:hypothetical protein